MTSTTDLTLTFEDTTITAFDTDSDSPTFLASPVAKKLGHRDARDMLRNLEDDEKGRHIVPTLGGPQEMAVITLPGLMHALSNRRPGAIKDPGTRAMVTRFQRWVNHEVLPTILRTGRYVPDNQTAATDRDDAVAALIATNETLRDALREMTRLLAQVNTTQAAPFRGKAKDGTNVTVESAADFDACTLAERWYLTQIKEHGYAVSKDCPFEEDATAHRRMMHRFALISKPKRVPREGHRRRQTERVIVATDLTPKLP